MLTAVGFYVKSLSAHRAVEKLVRNGIVVLAAREVQKNVIDLHIRTKDMKKAFAILQSSCYNIENIRYFGLARVRKIAVQAVGLFIGAVVFLGGVLFFDSRVLAVEIVGSGAYYEREILAILKEEGVENFSAMPSDLGRLTARVLALPRVEYCSFKGRGGVLTVEVQCAENIQPIAGMPLASLVTGTIEELIVVRGTALFQVGDEVQAGDIVVADYTLAGEAQIPSLVIAKVTVRREFSVEYELGEEAAAVAQAVLDYGEPNEVHTSKTQRGWRVEGVVRTSFSVNLD